LTQNSPLILATGGGAWMDPLNRRRLEQWGTVVWLKAKFSTIWRRVSIQKAQRPLVGLTTSPSPEFLELYRKRQKVYSRAVIRVLTDDRTPAQSCKLLLKKLKSDRSAKKRPSHARSR
jgi:shikimate kinase